MKKENKNLKSKITIPCKIKEDKDNYIISLPNLSKSKSLKVKVEW